MLSTLKQPNSTRFLALATGALGLFTLGLLLLDAKRQGVWIDEIWSLWMSDPSVPYPRVLTERWLQDLHPPLFHAVNWLLSPVLGNDIFVRRLLNLFPCAYFLAILTFTGRRSARSARFALVLAVVALTSRGAAWYFPEHRSYFTELCLTGALCALMRELFVRDRDIRLAEEPALVALTFLTIVVTLNLHFIAVVLVGSFLGMAALALLARRRWWAAGLVIAATAVAFGPVLMALWAELGFLTAVGDFWTKSGPLDTLKMLVATPAHSFADNLVAGFAAVVAAYAAWRGRRGAASASPPPAWSPNTDDVWFAATLFAGIVFGMAFLLVVNISRPLVVPRYLITLVPLTAGVVATLGADLLLSRRGWTLLFLINAALVLAVFSVKPLTNPRWEGTIKYIRARVEQCPSTKVYGLDTTIFPYPRPFNEHIIQDWGYQAMGRENGFSVTLLDPRRPNAPVLSNTCPTLLWAEHINETKAPKIFATSPLAATLHNALKSSRIFRKSNGFVVDIPPTPVQVPAGTVGAST